MHACAIGHGVGILRVEELALINGVYVANVGKFCFVQLRDKALGDGSLDDIVVRNHHIVIAALSGLQAGQHGLVCVKAGIVHLIAGFCCESIQHLLREHALPGVQVHFAFDFRPLRAAAAGKKAQHKAKADGQGNKFFHSFSS